MFTYTWAYLYVHTHILKIWLLKFKLQSTQWISYVMSSLGSRWWGRSVLKSRVRGKGKGPVISHTWELGEGLGSLLNTFPCTWLPLAPLWRPAGLSQCLMSAFVAEVETFWKDLAEFPPPASACILFSRHTTINFWFAAWFTSSDLLKGWRKTGHWQVLTSRNFLMSHQDMTLSFNFMISSIAYVVYLYLIKGDQQKLIHL